jgi:Zn-dependent protease with chaperone function
VTGGDGGLLATVPLKSVQASSRLGAMRRRLDFPDGSSFDTLDNDGVDRMLSGGRLHRLENSWRIALISLVWVALAAAAFVLFGIPAAADWMARNTSPGLAAVMGRQTLATLDRVALDPSRLREDRKAHYRALLAELSAQTPRGTAGYRLVFRRAPRIGPNAFALPDGSIIVTDEILALARRDEEIQGVLGHEMAHVDRAHGLQRVYQASLVPAAIAFVTGDASQLGQFATLLPGILLQSAYSRGFEEEADADSARLMRQLNKNPAALADLLERMDKQICGQKNCGAGWISSHPDTEARAARLRQK